jgi:hypothetical protein
VISVEEFVERLCLVGASKGPRRFPRAAKDRGILMHSFVLGLDSGREYSEPQVNDAIQAWKRDIIPAIETDHVTLRRLLVDWGQLERSADGARYQVGFPPRNLAFDLEVYDLDLKATVAAFRDHQERERAERRRQAQRSAPGGD